MFMNSLYNSNSGVGFLIRRSSAIRRFFAGFLRCDSLTIVKSFLKKIPGEFSGSFVRFLCKFPVNSRAIFLRNNFIIVRLLQPTNAKNLRIAELRLMRNPPQLLVQRLFISAPNIVLILPQQHVLQLWPVFVLLCQLKTKQLVLTICVPSGLQDPTSHFAEGFNLAEIIEMIDYVSLS